MTAGAPLVCPECGLGHGGEERFCTNCGMPLVFGPGIGEPPREDRAAELARKVRPQYARGEPVRIARGRNQTEAEFIQGLLLEEGIPSMLRRSQGFDVPDFLAAGPRDVLVPEAGAAAARDVLLEAELLPAGPQRDVVSFWPLLGGVLLGAALLIAVVLLLAA